MSNIIQKIVEEKDLLNELGSHIESIANSAISSRDTFNVALSGGSLIQMLERCLPKLNTNWEKWRIFFCDERVVSFSDPESTYGLYRKALTGIIPVKDEQYVAISPELSAANAAVDYEMKLKKHFGSEVLPKFDLLLLGVGPDGHTCSLFPQHPLLNEETSWVAPITDSPKPPPSRVTLTFPVINNTRNCIFALSGKGKANIVKRILVDKEDLPVNRVKPTDGTVYWLLDKEAASEL